MTNMESLFLIEMSTLSHQSRLTYVESLLYTPWEKMRLCAAQKSRTFRVFPHVPHFLAFGAVRVHFLHLAQCGRNFFDFFSIFFEK